MKTIHLWGLRVCRGLHSTDAIQEDTLGLSIRREERGAEEEGEGECGREEDE